MSFIYYIPRSSACISVQEMSAISNESILAKYNNIDNEALGGSNLEYALNYTMSLIHVSFKYMYIFIVCHQYVSVSMCHACVQCMTISLSKTTCF